jgi:hypothetical protein
VGYGILGVLLARVSGVPYRDFVDANVLRPLGMTATVWDAASVPPEHRATGYDRDGAGLKPAHEWRMGALESAGRLLSSVRDVGRYAAFHLAAWPPRDDADPGPLRRSSVREMERQAQPIGLMVFPRAVGYPQFAHVVGYGFGWETLETCQIDRIVHHGGAVPGFNAEVAMLPEHGVALVAMTNTAETDLGFATRRALLALQATGALAKRVLPPDAALLAARDAMDGLLERWDDARAARTFAKAGLPGVFLSKRQDWESVHADHGACHPVGEIVVRSAWQARWHLACERGAIDFTATLAPDDRTRVKSVDIDRSLPPDARLSSAATRLSALIARWDDHVADEILSATVDRAKTKQAFAGAASDHGACSVDHAESDSERFRARFALKCDRGALELHAELDDKSGKIVQALLAAPWAADGKCPP